MIKNKSVDGPVATPLDDTMAILEKPHPAVLDCSKAAGTSKSMLIGESVKNVETAEKASWTACVESTV